MLSRFHSLENNEETLYKGHYKYTNTYKVTYKHEYFFANKHRYLQTNTNTYVQTNIHTKRLIHICLYTDKHAYILYKHTPVLGIAALKVTVFLTPFLFPVMGNLTNYIF